MMDEYSIAFKEVWCWHEYINMQAVEQVEMIDFDNTNSFPEFCLSSDQT